MSDEKYTENNERPPRPDRDRGFDPQMDGRDGDDRRGGKGKVFFKKKVCKFCNQKLKIDYRL